MRSPLAPLLAFGLVAAALLPLAAVADEGEEEDEEERERGRDARDREERSNQGRGREKVESDEEEREFRTKIEHDKVEFDLSRRAAKDDHVHMNFGLGDARLHLQFQGRENDTKSQLKLEARLGNLIEFRDANANARYDLGEEIVSAWSLGDEGNDDVDSTGRAEWRQPVAEEIVADGQSGQKITAIADLGGSGEFELRFYVFGDFVDLGNATLHPTGVKFDIEIRNYPFAASDTQLGLFVETRVKAKLDWSHAHDEMGDDEDGVAATQDVDGKPVTLLFTWKETAAVDGVDTAVASTLVRSREETVNGEEGTETQRREEFVLSYARGSVIVHDPEAFVSIQSFSFSLPIGNAWMVLGGAGLAAVVVVATLFPRLRRFS